MKLVAFDIGNVLVDVNFDPFVDYLKTYIEEPLFWLDTIHALHDVGHISMKQAFASKKELKEHVPDLLEAWSQVVVPKEDMVNFALELQKSKKNKFALWSNMGIEHYTYLKNHRKMNKIFSKFINHLSFQVGARKPTKLFYQSFNYQYPYFTDILFIDDLEANLNHNWIDYSFPEHIIYNTIKFDETNIELSQEKIEIILGKYP